MTSLATNSALAVNSGIAPQTVFAYASSPGDYVGQGQTVVLTSAQMQFKTSGQAGANSISFAMDNTGLVPPGGPYINWNAAFAAPKGTSLAAGTYTNALRIPFQGLNAGISIFGNGRGCNQDFGQFQILQISYDPTTGVLTNFAADFVQHCESATAPPLTGSIRYNSTIPLPEVIGPVITITNPLNSQGCIEATSSAGALVTAIASATGGANLQYAWSTSTGLKMNGTQISLPVGLGDTVTLLLTATDSVTGNSATTSSSVCSSDTTPPVITIKSPVSGATYRELPMLNLKVTDAVDHSVKQVHVAIGENADFALLPDQTLKTKITPRRAVGDMIETQFIVTARDASGNVGRASVTSWLGYSLR